MMLCAIVAVDLNNAIGFENRLIYALAPDMQRFKELTENHTVIMGRKTYFSLKKKPLPKRRNIVLTKSEFETEAEICHDLQSLARMLENENDEVFVIGGQSVYELLLPYCKRIYLTKIFAAAKNYDAVFPQLDKRWVLSGKSEIMSFNELDFCYYNYENTNPKNLYDTEKS